MSSGPRGSARTSGRAAVPGCRSGAPCATVRRRGPRGRGRPRSGSAPVPHRPTGMSRSSGPDPTSDGRRRRLGPRRGRTADAGASPRPRRCHRASPAAGRTPRAVPAHGAPDRAGRTRSAAARWRPRASRPARAGTRSGPRGGASRSVARSRQDSKRTPRRRRRSRPGGSGPPGIDSRAWTHPPPAPWHPSSTPCATPSRPTSRATSATSSASSTSTAAATRPTGSTRSAAGRPSSSQASGRRSRSGRTPPVASATRSWRPSRAAQMARGSC